MSGRSETKHYPVETKLEAVQMFYEEGRTRREITEALDLRSEGRAETWMH